MALPFSGQISTSQINTELGRTSTSEISLDTAENGGYVTLNTNSCFLPDSANPASMSEWYGYDHNATTTKTRYFYGKLLSDISSGYPDWDIWYQVNGGGWVAQAEDIGKSSTTCAQRGPGRDLVDGDVLEVSVRDANGGTPAYNATTGISGSTPSSNCPSSGTQYSEGTTPFSLTLDKCTIYIHINVVVSGGNYLYI